VGDRTAEIAAIVDVSSMAFMLVEFLFEEPEGTFEEIFVILIS
jgi:hypothetical protein